MPNPSPRSSLWLLALGAVVTVLGVFEVALRILAPDPASDPRFGGGDAAVPMHVPLDSPELYGLNPAHPRISSQGLRNREVPFLKPFGTRRILLLGDSVTYGPAVADERTFASQLESALDAAGIATEVINAGVPGYTPYNELQYFRAKGRHFRADVVIAVFCPNDVANPRLHWRGYAEVGEIPDAAIPNSVYDREVIQPRLAREAASHSILDASYLFRDLRRRLAQLRGTTDAGAPDLDAAVRTFLTGEDDLGIEVLTDERSAEWRWLAGIYDQLRAAVASSGGKLVIAYVPVAYQLDESYPHRPQDLLARYCERHGIPFVNLLEGMRGHAPEELFLMDRLGDVDVWHLTGAGHDVVAAQLAAFLSERAGLL